MKKILLILITLTLLGCIPLEDVPSKERRNDLLGEYYLEEVTAGSIDHPLAKRIYQLKISSALKKNEIDVETSYLYQTMRINSGPLMDPDGPDKKIFKNAKIIEKNRFIIEEIRQTDWCDRINTVTDIKIKGELIGSKLSVDFNFSYPEQSKASAYEWRLTKK